MKDAQNARSRISIDIAVRTPPPLSLLLLRLLDGSAQARSAGRS